MKALCRLFGHTPEPWFTLSCHPQIGAPCYDGALNAHRHLTAACKRCGAQYTLGKVIDPILSGDVLVVPRDKVAQLESPT